MASPTEKAAKTIRIQYFAQLREERGLSSETIDTDAETPRQLYDFLRDRHTFSLPPERLSVAINEAFADWHRPLSNEDTVVFIPPVAGG